MKTYMPFLLIFFLVACNPTKKDKPITNEIKGSDLKERSPVIEKPAPFIYLNLEVHSYSRDSIIVHITLRNDGKKAFKFYKPLLPFDSMTENLFSILEKESYDPVGFNGKSKEKYLQFDSETSTYIIPQLGDDHFISLQPGQTLEIKSNIAKIYSFGEFLDKKLTEFKIIYVSSFPYVVDGKQVMELDSVDNKQKPVYYFVTVKERKDPDLMRVAFKIPR